MSAVLKTILEKMQSTTLNHKKKLITLVIFILAGYIAKKKLKLHHIISVVMFAFRIFSKVFAYLPLPKFAEYRTMLPFRYREYQVHDGLPKTMKVDEIILRIKNKQAGSLDEMKISVLCGVTLSLVLYNVESLYDLVKDKYIADFGSLDAAQLFQNSIQTLKKAFSESLPLLKEILLERINNYISELQTSSVLGVTDIQELFEEVIKLTFQQTESQYEKVRQKYGYFYKSLPYEKADNLFRTSKEFVQSKKKGTSVFSWIGKLFSGIIPKPIEQITQERYQIHQFLYTLTLKKYRDYLDWPNEQSKHLFKMVLDECEQLMNSTNFCMISYKNAELNKQIFMNRVRIYFLKKAKCQKKRLIQLLPIFYKIIQEQFCDPYRKEQLYERQVSNSLKDTQYGVKDALEDVKLRNYILNEVYLTNEFVHLNKDFQLKYFNERDSIQVNPVKTNSKVVEEKDEMEQMLGMFEKSKQQGQQPIKKQNLLKDLLT